MFQPQGIQSLRPAFLKAFGGLIAIGLFLLLALPKSEGAAGFQAYQQVLKKDNQFYRAGTIYDYRSDTDNRMFSLWVPPGVHPIRGIFIDGNAGVSGNKTGIGERSLTALAMRFGFGVMTTSNVSGSQTFASHGRVLFDGLDAFADLGDHPELRHVPFISHGNSSGGGNAYGLAMLEPARCICFTANVLAGPNPVLPPVQGYTVPGVFTIGEVDPLVASNRVDVPNAMAAARAANAPWAWAMIQGMGHEHRRMYRFYYPYWETMIRWRLPAEADPSTGPVVLNPLVIADGWLVDDQSWEEGIAFIAPAKDYPRLTSQASWLPDPDLAYLFRGLVSWHTPLVFSIDGVPDYYDTTDRKSLSMDQFYPGRRLRLRVATGTFPWTKLQFYRGSEKLGEVTEGEPVFDHLLGYDRYANAFTVVAEDADGHQRTAIMQTVFAMAESNKDPGWVEVADFGWYYYRQQPWLYHPDLGWVWASDAAIGATESTYLWSTSGQHWLWMRTAMLPWYYSYNPAESGWVMWPGAE